MLSLDKGIPIAKTNNKRGHCVIIHVYDPDNETHRQEIEDVDLGSESEYSGDSYESSSDDEWISNRKKIIKAESKKAKQGGARTARGRRQDDFANVTEFSCPEGIQLTPIPNLEARSVDYVAGPSGSGKSTIASGMAHEFKKVYPKKPIYIFSRTDARDDPAYAKLNPLQIDLESLVQEPFDVTTEIPGGCLMIFDDCQTIQNDKMKKEIDKLMEDCMEIGRKLGCWMIISNHLVIPNEKKLARTIMNELHTLTVFPKSGSSQQIRYALKTYFGLTNNQIDKILALKSRWVKISKSYPMYVLHSGGAYIL